MDESEKLDAVDNPGRDYPVYTPEMTKTHTEALSASRWVQPSQCADGDCVLGQTPGWAPPDAPSATSTIPPQPVYGYKITDAGSRENPKIAMLVTAGNHGLEYTGDWVLRGMVDFLIGDSGEAAALRKQALFCVYPNINPEGRYQAIQDIHPEGLAVPVKDCAEYKPTHCRGNPELYLAGEDDHNRVWTTPGLFTTVDLITAAMRADTGGHADYLWDLHGPQEIGNWRSPQGRISWDCPYGRALRTREPDVVTAGLPEARYKPRIGFPPGKLCVWANSQEGLCIQHTYVYEPGYWTEARLREAGRNLALALFDVL